MPVIGVLGSATAREWVPLVAAPWRFLAVFFLVALAAPSALAEDYPTRPITIVVPFTPGERFSRPVSRDRGDSFSSFHQKIARAGFAFPPLILSHPSFWHLPTR